MKMVIRTKPHEAVDIDGMKIATPNGQDIVLTDMSAAELAELAPAPKLAPAPNATVFGDAPAVAASEPIALVDRSESKDTRTLREACKVVEVNYPDAAGARKGQIGTEQFLCNG